MLLGTQAIRTAGSDSVSFFPDEELQSALGISHCSQGISIDREGGNDATLG
jgi:hypothetical protein